MPSQVLTLLKYVFLAVLYLFFLRVLRAVWTELREPKPTPIMETGSDVPASSALDPLVGGTSPERVVAATPWNGPAARHVIVTNPMSRRRDRYDLGDELTIGRSDQCGLNVSEDSFVSQFHARMFQRDGQVWVEDLGSTNGTLVNQQPITQPVSLRDGDVVQVGKTVLELAP